MYELDCHGVIPCCERVIRAESQEEVMRRAVMQAKQLGVETITQRLMDAIRDGTHEDVRH